MKVVRIKNAEIHWRWCEGKDRDGEWRKEWDKKQEPIIFLHHLIGCKNFHEGAYWWGLWWDVMVNRRDGGGESENVQIDTLRHTSKNTNLSNLCLTIMALRQSMAVLLDILISWNISQSTALHPSFPLLSLSLPLSPPLPLSVMRRSPQCQWWWLSGSLSTSLINLGNREELASHTPSHAHTIKDLSALILSHPPPFSSIHWGIELSHTQWQRK